jgi:hypothetical protein
MPEMVEFERVTAVMEVVNLAVDLSAWVQGVVQMLLECPQA